MNFSTHRFLEDAQWKRYRHLELVSESVPNPASRGNPLTSSLNVLWRGLLALLMDELVEEQRVEYLDRCWSLRESETAKPSPSRFLRRFWVLIE